MKSWTERRLRRGGITESEFLASMRSAGFQHVEEQPEYHVMHEFHHPDTPSAAYIMPAHGESFRMTLERFQRELRDARNLAAAR